VGIPVIASVGLTPELVGSLRAGLARAKLRRTAARLSRFCARTKRIDVIKKIGFGGGCHWCTEGIFQMLAGVTRVEQRFIRSDPPSDTWAEGVIVHFHPSVISLSTLIEVHLRTHRATAPYIARSKYRSAIYVHERSGETGDWRDILATGRIRRSYPDPDSSSPLRTFRCPLQELLRQRSSKAVLPTIHRSQARYHPSGFRYDHGSQVRCGRRLRA
jgi:Peptide methionine sulfoxide reductase